MDETEGKVFGDGHSGAVGTRMLALLTLVTSFSCSHSNQASTRSSPRGHHRSHTSTPPTPLPKPVEWTVEEAIYIHGSLPRLTQHFHIGSTPEDCWVELRHGNKIFQRLMIDEAPWGQALETCKIDGDSFKDLRLLAPSPAASAHYLAWTMDSRTRQFRRLEGYEDIPNPEPDPKAKLVRGWQHISSTEGVSVTYRLKDGRITELPGTDSGNSP